MPLGRRTVAVLNRLFRRHGLELLSSRSIYDWQRNPITRPGHSGSALSADARAYLRPDNPRLRELQARYGLFESAATLPLIWEREHLAPEDIPYFRGDNAFVWQLRGRNMNALGYAITAYYIKANDRLGLWERLQADDAFGNFTFEIANKTISRELLDSMNEIAFLDRQLGIASKEGPCILDIGAGYGRLAHRMLEALPNVAHYFCTDAVAASTFVSEFYLRFREVGERASVLPLDEVEDTLAKHPVDLALNIHSFSECSIPAIDWWLSILARYRVRHLMISPNPVEDMGSVLLTNDRQEMEPVIQRHGYRLIAMEPKFSDPVVQKFGLDPTFYFLFELDDSSRS